MKEFLLSLGAGLILLSVMIGLFGVIITIGYLIHAYAAVGWICLGLLALAIAWFLGETVRNPPDDFYMR